MSPVFSAGENNREANDLMYMSYKDVVWIFNEEHIQEFCVIMENPNNYKLIVSCIQYLLALLFPRL